MLGKNDQQAQPWNEPEQAPHGRQDRWRVVNPKPEHQKHRADQCLKHQPEYGDMQCPLVGEVIDAHLVPQTPLTVTLS
ncbi:MAG: hypothetical protein VX726_08830 [Planctomycetota bacterium]|nr:hypothetical protein [Planctomycetota bacterium]